MDESCAPTQAGGPRMEQKSRQANNHGPVTPIQTEYVRARERKEQIKKARKIRLYRRLAVFAVIAALIFGWMGWSLIEKNQAIAAKQEEKKAALAELEKLQEEGAALELELEKLDDPEYIAKLARKEYLLSEEGEIIFTLPDEEKKDKDKKDGDSEE
jgi:cell division protein DivIC